jgi:DNA-binding transcriptional ArsR family regulator
MGDEEDLRAEIRELREQLGRLRKALERVARPYEELVNYLERFESLGRAYFRILSFLERYGELSPALVVPEAKDPISIAIVRILFSHRNLNISQLTEALRSRRGTASRRIVRDRLNDLRELGVVEVRVTPRGKLYRVSDDVVSRWSRVLGLIK